MRLSFFQRFRRRADDGTEVLRQSNDQRDLSDPPHHETWCFRIRLHVAPISGLTGDQAELSLDESETVILRSGDLPKPLGDTETWLVLGSGFEDAAAAVDAAGYWSGILELVFARLRIGADFGRRAAQGGFTAAGLDWVASQARTDRPFLNDTHGTIVYPCEPRPMFARMGPGQGRVLQSPETLQAATRSAVRLGVRPSDVESLAFDLFGASFFELNQDARFLMLMMSLETMIKPQSRPQEVRRHVDSLIASTLESGLSTNQIQSIKGSLEWLYDESIGQAGRRLAGTLEPRRYGESSPTAFFTTCYQLRSQLVHGTHPRPARDEVGRLAANLEVFVADLLAGALRDDPLS